MAINVTASPLVVTLQLPQTVLHQWPNAARDEDLDLTYDVGYTNNTDTSITITLHGTWLSLGMSDSVMTVTVTLDADWAPSAMLNVDAHLDVTLDLIADVSFELPKSNWIKWSNIGSLDFTIWKDNVAGERPMPWNGWVYGIRKLGGQVMVYGEHGVSMLKPSSYNWGLASVTNVGVLSKTAICGNEAVHYFIDAKYRLCRMIEKLDVLGYDEFISAMANPVLSYDDELGRVFVCDGSVGYVYSESNKGFGRGPANITGFAPGYVAASGAIVDLPFEICTDIYDMGTRKDKTIMEVDFGFYTTYPVWAAIDWRKDKSEAFATTPWTRVNPNGRAALPCWGREFRFRLKLYTYDADFKLDYFKVNGVLHNYSFLDSFLRGRQV